ncbi:alpha/beta hydrolase [Nocardioides sp.]|uniref:alpha/beta fold hydrolase n=1 Tax=Nocardioides sp. TaxID=35761 RepID=UPI002EDA720E
MRTQSVTLNGQTISYVEQGEGPLVLLLHGFPESAAVTFRHTLPALARAGFRAVAPSMRGFAPSSLPASGEILLPELVEDALALHDALDGDERAVLLGHDWGAATAWAAATAAPERWARVVTSDVPPLQFFAGYAASFEGIERLNHFWFFQMGFAEHLIAADDNAYLAEVLQRRWTGPDHDATEDIAGMRSAIGDPERLKVALSLYRRNFAVDEMGTPEWESAQVALWGDLPTQPTLYLHGTEDHSVRLTEEDLAMIEKSLAPGSEAHLIQGAGHIVPAEKPDDYNRRVIDFLTR